MRSSRGEGRGWAVDDEEDDDPFFNDFSGTAEDIVQARDIHGNVSFTSHTYGPSDHGMVVGTVFRGAGLVYFFALFVFATTYAGLLLDANLGFWDWVKLVISSIVLVGVFIRTEWAIFDDLFASLRRLLMLVVVVLGFAEGARLEFLKDLTTVLGQWLTWHF